MTPPVAAAETVPERHYTHHEHRGETPHRSNPAVIQRELTTLDVTEGMNVLEIGTGSGYSGALLADLVGAQGRVTSLDIDPYLTRWANLIHQQRGVHNIACHPADGTAGHPERGPYQRLIAWCTPPLLPHAWTQQLDDDALIVAPLPLTALPNLTVVTKIRVTGGQPHVEALFHGGYIEATGTARTDFTTPGRWVDWENRLPTPSWISIAWREQDDWRSQGAHAALNHLLNTPHTETYDGPEPDWASWRTWAAAQHDTALTMTELPSGGLGLGHSTPTTAAVLQQNGTILADNADSPSLAALRTWLKTWEDAGRPAPDTYTPALLRTREDSMNGWRLHLSR